MATRERDYPNCKHEKTADITTTADSKRRLLCEICGFSWLEKPLSPLYFDIDLNVRRT